MSYRSGVSTRNRAVLEAALGLPRKARGELVRELLESLDESSDPDAERLWTKEIETRAKEALSGHGRGPSLEEGFRMALREIGKKKSA